MFTKPLITTNNNVVNCMLCLTKYFVMGGLIFGVSGYSGGSSRLAEVS